MKKSMAAAVIGIFLALAVGPAWGDDLTAAGISLTTTGTTFSSNLTSTTTGAPALSYAADASGVGTISSGMAVEGFFGGGAFPTNFADGFFAANGMGTFAPPALAGRTSYEQFSSAKGTFNFSVNYNFQSQMPSVGTPSPFNLVP